ncbi:hypothetical protein GZ78_27300 [Endozoicomonas numazuensis]|uniref:Uncharacterized protein n=2 Tax=Endozoicomonas numazuensis TaxID=1137799 RepID=A0A081N138_9GAMM|nr:hypothetical protein GZ78_27300 [Endozoicomonas numazuensis]
MEAYLKYLRSNVQQEENKTAQVEDTVKTEDSVKVEAEYLRSIYKVLPRERALQMTLRQTKAHTSIRP